MRILTDSAADFSMQELAQYDITCVPMQITFGSNTYTDGVNLSPDIFWKRLTSGETPKTSQPSPDAFLSIFEQARDAGEAVICVLLSSALSGTLQSAVLAKDMAGYDSIYIVDSRMAASAEKLLVLQACRLRDEGRLTPKEIAGELEHFRSRIKLYACLDTLDYLARGGRIPAAAASVGSLVQLKPIITLSEEGCVEMIAKAFGRHRAVEAMVKLAKTARMDPDYPLLHLYACRPDNSDAFAARLWQLGLGKNAQDSVPIGATIATHIGPDAYGFVYVEKA